LTEGRKVAAILVVDVVGYSRLAGADEERTLAQLHSDLIDPIIAVHNERLVKRGVGEGDSTPTRWRSVSLSTGRRDRPASYRPDRRRQRPRDGH
jgi:adenylate cyclase